MDPFPVRLMMDVVALKQRDVCIADTHKRPATRQFPSQEIGQSDTRFLRTQDHRRRS